MFLSLCHFLTLQLFSLSTFRIRRIRLSSDYSMVERIPKPKSKKIILSLQLCQIQSKIRFAIVRLLTVNHLTIILQITNSTINNFSVTLKTRVQFLHHMKDFDLVRRHLWIFRDNFILRLTSSESHSNSLDTEKILMLFLHPISPCQ